jgi:hypothetical protein
MAKYTLAFETKEDLEKAVNVLKDHIYPNRNETDVVQPRRYTNATTYNRGGVLPLALVQSGGSSGTATTQCDYKYNVYDIAKSIDKPELLDVNIGFMPHQYRRPLLGAFVPASFGLGYYADKNTVELYALMDVECDIGDLIVTQANETLFVAVCEDAETEE